MEEENNEPKHKREPLKSVNSHHLSWKKKLRESCYKRVKEDRAILLWKSRECHQQSDAEEEFMKSAFQDIVSDELKKLKNQKSVIPDSPKSSSREDEMLWEYDGIHTVDQEECEDILLEMQRFFYEDVSLEVNQRGAEEGTALEDEEDEYLASAVQEYMCLNDTKAWKEQMWCPICKKGELQENLHFIHCSLCQFKLNRGTEVNMAILRNRLAEAHEEHLDRGCRSKPDFCVETVFDLTALYLQCQHCDTFEIVI